MDWMLVLDEVHANYPSESFYWNEHFQAIVDLPAQTVNEAIIKMLKLQKLYNAFVKEASRLGILGIDIQFVMTDIV